MAIKYIFGVFNNAYLVSHDGFGLFNVENLQFKGLNIAIEYDFGVINDTY